ncbi:MAG: hypothetical protein Q8904_12130 [Bacteroidota bacterium]|nr:hypothetical protein [Bacteroidota bacterium]MDP4289779.1 hypothetical protein [Bacteroidota bacterium]
MNILLEIVELILPGLLVLAAVYLMQRHFWKLEIGRSEKQLLVEARKITMPVRLQAYERLALLMERISPAPLVLRVAKPGIGLSKLQQNLIQSIHEEFEHNLSQQIYVSGNCWSMVRSAVEQTIQQVNVTAAGLDSNADEGTFAARFMQNVLEQTNNPAEQALFLIRSEAARLF